MGRPHESALDAQARRNCRGGAGGHHARGHRTPGEPSDGRKRRHARRRRYATVYFAGKATPVPIPAASRSLTVRFYYRSGGVWRLKATVTVRASSSTGAWRLKKTGVTSARGIWRVRTSAAGTSTLTSAVSSYRYYQVY